MIDSRLDRYFAEFIDPAIEHAYRVWSLPETARQARLALLIAVAAVMLPGFNDYVLFGPSLLLAGLRGSFSPAQFDRSVLGWSLALQFQTLATAMTRLPGYVSNFMLLRPSWRPINR